MHPELDPELGSSLDYEYSVTHVAAKETCYSPCVRWSRGGASGNSVGGEQDKGGGGRGFSGYVFAKGI